MHHVDASAACPSCGRPGKSVAPLTVVSLLTDDARGRTNRTDGFRFCREAACAVTYFQPDTGLSFTKQDVRVRVGSKESTSPRPVCYCFGHSVEDIEHDVARTGDSGIPAAIAERCRQGLARCEETNPQGACCLGDVHRAVRHAQDQLRGTAAIAEDVRDDCRRSRGSA